jgi:hypothetical protein
LGDEIAMKIHRAPIDPEKFRGIPDEERALLTLLGHAVNEINVLNKTFYLACQHPDEPQWRVHAHLSQSLVFARALTGKLWETWVLLQNGYFGTSLSKKYHEKLDDEAVRALDGLKKYFGRNNLIKTIRDRFAFHYSLSDANCIPTIQPTKDELVMYLAKDNGNTLFYFSDVIVSTALLEAIDPGAPERAMNRLMTESAKVVNQLNQVAGAVMATIVEGYLMAADGKLLLEEIEIGEPPLAESVELPFFITSTLLEGDVS